MLYNIQYKQQKQLKYNQKPYLLADAHTSHIFLIANTLGVQFSFSFFLSRCSFLLTSWLFCLYLLYSLKNRYFVWIFVIIFCICFFETAQKMNKKNDQKHQQQRKIKEYVWLSWLPWLLVLCLLQKNIQTRIAFFGIKRNKRNYLPLFAFVLFRFVGKRLECCGKQYLPPIFQHFIRHIFGIIFE